MTLASGERLDAATVIDARGPRRLAGVAIGWQKFLGQELRLAGPHGLVRPVIMDAAVSQIDGYHFVYLLPFTADRVLVEDTYYSDTPDIDEDALRARIAAYAAARGWRTADILQEERGALPIPLAGDFGRFWRDAAPAGGAVPLGLRAGLFHAVTGYSLPDAARTAVALAGLAGPLSSDRLRNEIEARAEERWRAGGFDRMLNRLLFLAGRPEHRHRVLDRFHRLPQPLIERFYAGRIPARDRFRILCGIPPVPVRAAIRVLPESAAPLPT